MKQILFQTNLDVLYFIKRIYHANFYQNIRVQYVNPSTFRRSICTYACNVLRAVYESEPALCVQSLKTFTAHLSIFVCVYVLQGKISQVDILFYFEIYLELSYC